jgi:hypothetical protein
MPPGEGTFPSPGGRAETPGITEGHLAASVEPGLRIRWRQPTSVIQRARVLGVSYARRARASRLRAVTLFALTPTLGPAQLARVLGRGIPAATMALKELVGLGVAVELTGGRTHRLYGLSDLAPVRLARRDGRHAVRRPGASPEHRRADAAAELLTG